MKQYVFLDLKRDAFVRFSNSQQIKDFLMSKISVIKSTETVIAYYGGIKKSQSFIFKLHQHGSQASEVSKATTNTTTGDIEELDAASVDDAESSSMESLSHQRKSAAIVAALTSLQQDSSIPKRRIKSEARKSLSLAKRLSLFRKSNPVATNFDDLVGESNTIHQSGVFDPKEFTEVLEDCRVESNKWICNSKTDSVSHYSSIVNCSIVDNSCKEIVPKVQKLKSVGEIKQNFHELMSYMTHQHFYTLQDSNLKKTHVLSVGRENQQAHLITLEKFKYKWPLNKRYCIKYYTIRFDPIAERYILLFKPCFYEKYDFSMRKKSNYIKMYHKGAFVIEKVDEQTSKVFCIQSFYFGGQSKTAQQIMKKKYCPLEALKKCIVDRFATEDQHTLFSQRMKEVLHYNKQNSENPLFMK